MSTQAMAGSRLWLPVLLSCTSLVSELSAYTWSRNVRQPWDIPGKCNDRTVRQCGEPLAGYHACQSRPPETITVLFYSYDITSRTVREAVPVVIPSEQAPKGYADESPDEMKARILSLRRQSVKHVGQVRQTPITSEDYLDFMGEVVDSVNVVRFDKRGEGSAWLVRALEGMHVDKSARVSMTEVLKRAAPTDFQPHVTPASGQVCLGAEPPVIQTVLPLFVEDGEDEFVVWAQFGENAGQWIRPGIESLSTERAFQIAQLAYPAGLHGKSFCSELDSMGASFCQSECITRPRSKSIIYVMPRRFIVPLYGNALTLPTVPNTDQNELLYWATAMWTAPGAIERGQLAFERPSTLDWTYSMIGLDGATLKSLDECEIEELDCQRGMFSYTRRSLKPSCVMLEEVNPPAWQLSAWMLHSPSIIATDAVRSLWHYPTEQRAIAQQALSGKLMRHFRKLSASEHSFCQGLRRDRFLSIKSGGEVVPSDQVYLVGGYLDLSTVVPVIQASCGRVLIGTPTCSCEEHQYFARMTKYELQIYRLDLEQAAGDLLRNGGGFRVHSDSNGVVVHRVELRSAQFTSTVSSLEAQNGFNEYACNEIVVAGDVMRNTLHGCPARPVRVTAHGLSAPIPGLITLLDLGIVFTFDLSWAIVSNAVVMGLLAFGVSTVTYRIGESFGKVLLVTVLLVSVSSTIGLAGFTWLLKASLSTVGLPMNIVTVTLLCVGLARTTMSLLRQAANVLVHNEFLTLGLLGLVYVARALDDVLLAVVLYVLIGVVWPLNRKLVASAIKIGDAEVAAFIATEKAFFLALLFAFVLIGYDAGRVFTCMVGLFVISNNTLFKLMVCAFLGEALFTDFEVPTNMLYLGLAFSYLPMALDAGLRVVAVPRVLPADGVGKGSVQLSLKSRARLAFDLQTDLTSLSFRATFMQLFVHFDLFVLALVGLQATSSEHTEQGRRAVEKYVAEVKKLHGDEHKTIDVNYLKALARITGISDTQARLQTSTVYYTQQLSETLHGGFDRARARANAVEALGIEPIVKALLCASTAVAGPFSGLTMVGLVSRGMSAGQRFMSLDVTVQPANLTQGENGVMPVSDERRSPAVTAPTNAVERYREPFWTGAAGTTALSDTCDAKVAKECRQLTEPDFAFPEPFVGPDCASLFIRFDAEVEEEIRAAAASRTHTTSGHHAAERSEEELLVCLACGLDVLAPESALQSLQEVVPRFAVPESQSVAESLSKETLQLAVWGDFEPQQEHSGVRFRRSGYAGKGKGAGRAGGKDKQGKEREIHLNLAPPQVAQPTSVSRGQKEVDAPDDVTSSKTVAGRTIHVLDVEYADCQPLVDIIVRETHADYRNVKWVCNMKYDHDTSSMVFAGSIAYICRSPQEAMELVRSGITTVDVVKGARICVHYPVSFNWRERAFKKVQIVNNPLEGGSDSEDDVLKEEDGLMPAAVHGSGPVEPASPPKQSAVPPEFFAAPEGPEAEGRSTPTEPPKGELTALAIPKAGPDTFDPGKTPEPPDARPAPVVDWPVSYVQERYDRLQAFFDGEAPRTRYGLAVLLAVLVFACGLWLHLLFPLDLPPDTGSIRRRRLEDQRHQVVLLGTAVVAITSVVLVGIQR